MPSVIDINFTMDCVDHVTGHLLMLKIIKQHTINFLMLLIIIKKIVNYEEDSFAGIREKNRIHERSINFR